MDKLSDVVHKFPHELDPINKIVPVEGPRPRSTLEDDCLVMAIDEVPADLWGLEDIVDLNSKPLPEDLRDVDKVVDIQMGNEVWTVNSAVDAGFWDSPFVTNRSAFSRSRTQDPTIREGLVPQDLETASKQILHANRGILADKENARWLKSLPTSRDFDDKAPPGGI
ncbi:hypothetical protein RHMOL_Rhmol13G0187500 [Rhododendron molle]|uniref:Uncharacterized protein n=1 Tax=Rhododendron molle TaxID=49168 RepID=A0ACC0L8R2_RHOML|nr:hypothetical protein RHMOL_Rhmol13G0187500 [Rhododendron molle]